MRQHDSLSFLSLSDWKMAATSVKLGVIFVSLITLLILSFSSYVSSTGQLITITEDSWADMLEGEWMVEFYAPWCPACKALEPVWKEFSSWSDDLGLKIGSIDVTTQPGLSGRFLVTALPTIYHVKDGVFRQYRGARDKDSFMNFIEQQKWKSIEPVNKWKNPASFQMSVVSMFFRISMSLRELHNKIIEEIGLPPWLSYVLFGVATILVGTILGLILVVVVDYFFPPKYDMPLDYKKTDERPGDKNEVNEVDDDIVEDDTQPTETETEIRQRRPEAEGSVASEN